MKRIHYIYRSSIIEKQELSNTGLYPEIIPREKETVLLGGSKYTVDIVEHYLLINEISIYLVHKR